MRHVSFIDKLPTAYRRLFVRPVAWHPSHTTSQYRYSLCSEELSGCLCIRGSTRRSSLTLRPSRGIASPASEPEVPDPALEHDPQARLALPRHHLTPPARGLGRALQHHPRAYRDFRRDPALHRGRLQSIVWIRVGTTQGRERCDRYTKRAQPKKDIWLRLLRRDWKRTLNRQYQPAIPARPNPYRSCRQHGAG